MNNNHTKQLNKFFYSYYSVLAAGIIFLTVLFLLFLCSVDAAKAYATGSFSHAAVFFMCLCTLIISTWFFISNIVLIRKEGFKKLRLLGLFLTIANALMLCLIYFVPKLYPLLSPDRLGARPLVKGPLGSTLYLILYYLMGIAEASYLYVLIMFYGFFIMSVIAADRKPQYDTDFVIILGCSISRKGGLLPLLKSRTNRAIHYAWEQEIATGNSVLYVPSGGKGRDEIMSEGSAMEFYLLSHGAEEYEVFPEKESKSTRENMIFSKNVIDGIMKDAKIEFCTSSYHVFRSGILAKQAGINARGIASETKWYFFMNASLREFAGFLTIFKKQHIIAFAAIILGAFADYMYFYF